MADIKNPFITDEKKINEVKDAGKALNFNEVQGPRRPNEVSISGSTLGAGINYNRTLDEAERLRIGAGLHSGGAFNGPIATVETSYDVLKGKIGSFESSLRVTALAGAGPDTGVGAVMLGGNVAINDRVTLGVEAGPAAFVPYGGDDPYRSSQTFYGGMARALVGVRFK
ncbi:MAG: hypothetical protein AABY33_08445 [Pseudomonadota bacterium]